MPDIAVKKASLFGESWQAIKQSAPAFLPWILGYALVLSIVYFCMLRPSDLGQQLQQNPNFFKQHPELAKQYMHEAFTNMLWMLPIVLVSVVANYVFTVLYLRTAMKNNRPDFSVDGFFYWFGKVFCKWLRAAWVLIPVVGFFIYMRSIIRYQVVSPLAVLRRGDELKTSWNLTEGNWWRVFGNSLLLMLVIFFIPMMIVTILGITSGAAMVLGGNARPPGLMIAISLVNGLLAGAASASMCVFSCTCYRVLLQESSGSRATLPPANPATPA